MHIRIRLINLNLLERKAVRLRDAGAREGDAAETGCALGEEYEYFHFRAEVRIA